MYLHSKCYIIIIYLQVQMSLTCLKQTWRKHCYYSVMSVKFDFTNEIGQRVYVMFDWGTVVCNVCKVWFYKWKSVNEFM